MTMKSKSVKKNSISNLFLKLNDIINSDTAVSLCGKHKQDFTRRRNMTCIDIIYYFISRCMNNSNSELTRYYSSMHKFSKRISRQGLNKAVKKLNPNVFNYIIKEFAKEFYQTDLVKKHKGYVLLAEDGTSLEIPYSLRNIYEFGFSKGRTVKEIDDVKTVVSKSGGLYDVTNGLFIDFSMHMADYSETPMAFEHLYHTRELLRKQPIIYLADRYYGSAEIISQLERFEYKYCIRGKSYFYKKQVANMKTNDEWIEVEVDEKWIKRFRFSLEAKDYRSDNHTMKIRVIKSKYEYINDKKETITKDLIFFTNLDEKEFNTQEIIELYAKRWDIEVSYKTTKSTEEIERYISRDSDVAKCCIYGKVIFHNIAGIIRKEMNQKLTAKQKKNKYGYCINITQLHNNIRASNILYYMMNSENRIIKKIINEIEVLLDKIKVPIRPDRHNKRWGRVIVGKISYRFTLDGRNHPKLIAHNHVLMTVKP